MAERFVEVDRNTPMLLPADLRDWVPEDDLVHFVIEAVKTLPSGEFVVNERGTGYAQYPPSMMLALLIYCYANGIFSSRRIERATYRDLGVRFLSGDTHPGHDTICSFRRQNGELIAKFFVRVLEGSGTNLKGSAPGGNGWGDGTDLGTGSLQGSTFRPRNHHPVHQVVPDVQTQLP